LATKQIKEIQSTDIIAISDKYQSAITNEFAKELLGFYETYLHECLKDKILTQDEIEDLSHLKNLLGLSDHEAKKLHNKISSDIYKMNYEEVIKDGVISEDEKQFLKNIQKNVLLSDEIAEKISVDSRMMYMQSQFNQIISDEKVSPDEWENFNQIAKNLNGELTLDETAKEYLAKYQLFWFIENEALPIQDVDINLQKKEVCYFTIDCEWLENRTRTKRINYTGVSTRIRIMKGVYYNIGNITPQRVTTEELTVIDSGKIYVTNKRIIFMGSKKNSTIKLDKILSLTPYSDAVGIEKDAGKSPILQVNHNADVLLRVLGRAINDY
ncbi:MAG: hypothetical protein KDB99_16070, partial [Chitinophagaceae bacterium]|nr:hypothetical protein [Chitinophagaceae bacterium]